MAVITVAQVSLTGLVNPTFTAATAAGDSFTNDGNTIYIIKNGGGGSTTATFDDVESVALPGAKTFDADVDVVIPSAQDAYIGPFPTARFGTSCGVTLTVDTSVTVAAVRVK